MSLFAAPDIIVLVGAPGEPTYEPILTAQARAWEQAAHQGGHEVLVLGLAASETNTLAAFTNSLATVVKTGHDPLWFVLLGHGTDDGKEAKLNLRGPDLTAPGLALLASDFSRPLIILNTASASGPFLTKLSATNRVVITATRTGSEQNYAHFGEFLAQAWLDPISDLDQDGQTSLLEAYLFAARATAEFYKQAGRLATEHPLLDDNGDGAGTPPDWFRGARAIKKPAQGEVDGLRARQIVLIPSAADQKLTTEERRQRDALEWEISRLRDQKATLPKEEYYRQLEGLLLKLARLENPAN